MLCGNSERRLRAACVRVRKHVLKGSMYYRYMSERMKKSCRQERALGALNQCYISYIYICIFSAHRGTVTTIPIRVSTLCPCT